SGARLAEAPSRGWARGRWGVRGRRLLGAFPAGVKFCPDEVGDADEECEDADPDQHIAGISEKLIERIGANVSGAERDQEHGRNEVAQPEEEGRDGTEAESYPPSRHPTASQSAGDFSRAQG